MMSKTILMKRGLKQNLPKLKEGELGLCTDTNEIFVGNTSNIQLTTKNDIVDDLTTGGTDKLLSAEQGKNLNTILEDTKTKADDWADFKLNGGVIEGPLQGKVGTNGQRFFEHTAVINSRNANIRAGSANYNGYPSWTFVIDDLDNDTNSNGLVYLLGNGQSDSAFKDNYLRPWKQGANESKNNIGSSNIPWDDIWLVGSSKTINGYSKLPNGLIMQWGVATVTSTTLQITLPVSYSTRHFSTQVTIVDTAITDGTTTAWVVGQNLKTITVRVSKSCTVDWFSIGY